MKTLSFLFLSFILALLNSSSSFSYSYEPFEIYDAKFFYDNSKPLKVGDTVDCFVYYRSMHTYLLNITSKNKNLVFINTQYINNSKDSIILFENANWGTERAIFFRFYTKSGIPDTLLGEFKEKWGNKSLLAWSKPMDFDSLTNSFDIPCSGTRDSLSKGEYITYEIRMKMEDSTFLKQDCECQIFGYDNFPNLKTTERKKIDFMTGEDSTKVVSFTVPRGLYTFYKLDCADKITNKTYYTDLFPETAFTPFSNLVNSAGRTVDSHSPFFYESVFLFNDQFHETSPIKECVLIGTDENGNEIKFLASSHSAVYDKRDDEYYVYEHNFTEDANFINPNSTPNTVTNLIPEKDNFAFFVYPYDNKYFPGFITKEGSVKMEFSQVNGKPDFWGIFSTIPNESIYNKSSLPDTIRFKFVKKVENSCTYTLRGWVGWGIVDMINKGRIPQFPTEIRELSPNLIVTLRNDKFEIIDYTYSDNEGRYELKNVCEGTKFLTIYNPFRYPLSVEKAEVNPWNHPPENGYIVLILSALSVKELELIPVALTVFPNPSGKKISLIYDEKYIFDYYEIYDLNGIKQQAGLLINNELPVNALLSGAYLLILKNDKFMITTKFVKE